MDLDQFVDVLGARVRFRVAGSGPPVVLIHGLGASLESWGPTINGLRERHTTYAFDFPGFGLSEPIDEALTPETATRATLAFMDAVGLRRVALIGSSLGGAIATMVAGVHPERCAALVLAAPAGFARSAGRTLCLMTLPLIGELAVAAVSRIPRAGIGNSFADPGLIPRWMIDCVRRDFARPTVRRSCLRVLRATTGLHGVRPEMVSRLREAASRITCPTLVVWGTHDRVIPIAQAAIVTRTTPRARLEVLNGLGHVPFLEAPDVFNAAVIAFLAEVEQPAASGGRG